MDCSEIVETLYGRVSVPSWSWTDVTIRGEREDIPGIAECGILCDLTSDCNTFTFQGSKCVLKYVSFLIMIQLATDWNMLPGSCVQTPAG